MAEVDVPKQYKAAVYDRPGILSTRLETLDMPDPGAGEVLIHLYESSPRAVKGSPPMFFGANLASQEIAIASCNLLT